MPAIETDPRIELIETLNPRPEAMMRAFTCHICNKRHLQKGKIARIWVYYQDGYNSLAALRCFKKYQENK